MATETRTKEYRSSLRDALERVAAGNADWTPWAIRALEEVASRLPEFTSDAVWAELRRRGIPPPTEPRAMGPVMLAGVRAAWIEATDRVVPARDPKAINHGRPQRVYRSRRVGDPGAQWPTLPEVLRFTCSRCGATSVSALEDTLSPRVKTGHCPQHGRGSFVGAGR